MADRLPADLLALILAHLTTHQRLRYASFVCKRWRAAAIHATTEFAPLKGANIAAASRVLTHIERLRLGSVLAVSLAEHAFPRLRSLTIDLHFSVSSSRGTLLAGPDCALRRLLERTTLTELSVPNAWHDEWADLLRLCAPSLTSLALFLDEHRGYRILELEFPRLTSLSLHAGRRVGDVERITSLLQRLVQRTHTQLETLAVDIGANTGLCGFWEGVPDLAFPRLRCATLIRHGACGALFSALARCHPSSTRLTLEPDPECVARTAPASELLLPPLTTSLRLGYADPSHLTHVLTVLAAQPRIASLELRLYDERGIIDRVARDPHLATKLTALHTVANLLPVLPVFPRLVRLVLYATRGAAATPPDASAVFASVTELDIAVTSPAVLCDSLRCFPSLRRLNARIERTCTAEECAALVDAQTSLESATFLVRRFRVPGGVPRKRVDTPLCAGVCMNM